MKTYKVTEPEVERTAESETTSEGSFAAMAFEWNNALLLAARRLWGEHLSYSVDRNQVFCHYAGNSDCMKE